jgi:hypothetical protein
MVGMFWGQGSTVESGPDWSTLGTSGPRLETGSLPGSHSLQASRDNAQPHRASFCQAFTSYTLLDSDLEEGMGQGTCGILFKHSAPLKSSQQDTKGQTPSCVALSLAG